MIDVVERVALDRLAAGGADQPLGSARGRHRLGRARAGHVVDLLFLHGAVEIVDAEPQRRLRHLDAGRDPERLDVRDVVEHQPRHGVHAQRVGRASAPAACASGCCRDGTPAG